MIVIDDDFVLTVAALALSELKTVTVKKKKLGTASANLIESAPSLNDLKLEIGERYLIYKYHKEIRVNLQASSLSWRSSFPDHDVDDKKTELQNVVTVRKLGTELNWTKWL